MKEKVIIGELGPKRKNIVWFSVDKDSLSLFLMTFNVIINPSVIEEFVENSDSETITTYHFEGDITDKQTEELAIICEKNNEILMKMVYDYDKQIYYIVCFNGDIEEINKKLKRKTNIFKYFADWGEENEE